MMRIAVEDLGISSSARDSDMVTQPRDRRKVATDHGEILAVLGKSNIGQHAFIGVVTIDPFKSVRRKINLVQRGLGAIELVQVGDQFLDAAVRVPLQQIPLHRRVAFPLRPLPKFTSHEQQFFSWVGPHVGIQETQVGELLLRVSRHLVEQRSLSVNHFVVRQRQHEVFGKGVDQAEGKLVVMVFAVNRFVMHVGQRIVHPAHIPFQAEAQSAAVGRSRDATPCGRFLGNGEDAGKLQMGAFVKLFEEIDRLQVFPAAVLIGNPLPFLAAVVQVKHGRNGVDSQSVDVVLVKPKQRVGDQVVTDFVAAVIENERVPVGMLALPRVGVLKKCGSVESGQPVGVFGKVGRYPVDDDANSVLMAVVDKVHKVLRTSVAAGDTVVADRLVAPTSREGMFGDRH